MLDTIQDVSSDTQSEIGSVASTERGSRCSDNREDMQEIALALGLESSSELHENRVRVDRRRLEHMILGDDDTLESADTFFQRVMEETNTHIAWPSRLKIGAKSKKDPNVLIAGRFADVMTAKKKVMAVLDTWSNRVTMKLDVSYTYHSHIIGKGGLTIKQVMEETSSHIHFPDSNRSSATEKSNQVSIAGEMDGVEKAREHVRNLMPLVFSFDLPIVGNLQPLPDPNSPYLLKIQQQYNVQIKFRTRAKLHGTLVVVKGCDWEVAQVKEATLLLVSHLCEERADQVLFQMSMEISPQHHPIVLGKNCTNVKMIMNRTATQIMIADASDPNIPSLKKSTISITGSIDSVYLARQQLLGCLPLVLMFELPEDMAIDSDRVTQIMQMLDVLIIVRHKPKQKTRSIVIKGIERHASNIYEARRQMLGLGGPRVVAEIPATYQIPDADPVFWGLDTDLLAGKIGRYSAVITPSTPIHSTPLPWLQFGLGQLLGSQEQQHQKLLLQQLLPPRAPSVSASSGYGSHSSLSSLVAKETTSAYSSTSVSSNASSLTTSPAVSPHNGNGSPIQGVASSADTTMTLGRLLPDINDFPDRRAPGCEKKSLQLAAQNSILQMPMPYDYDSKKLLAYKAMHTQQPVANRMRVPTSSWSGYGFSQSSPTPEVPNSSNGLPEPPDLDLWQSAPNNYRYEMASPSSTSSQQPQGSPLSNSNYRDATSTSSPHYSIDTTNIVSLFAAQGLEKYIGMFMEHEVDLHVFQNLNESDLREIGVSAFGARRKMLGIIADLKKWQNPFSGSAAPGAERRVSASTVLSNGNSDAW